MAHTVDIDEAAEARSERGPAGRRWKFPVAAFFVALLAFVGVVVMLYPAGSAWYSQYQQSRLIVSVEQGFVQEEPTALEAELARAQDYNEALTGGALVASGANVPTAGGTTDPRFEYSSLLRANDDGVMGRLRIGAIDLDLPIYHGTSDATLAVGVGHLEGTALPIGGVSTHSVLTAHRGLPSAELFTKLDQVTVGDTFTIEVFGEVLVYRVAETRVVQPEENETLNPQYGRDLVTLVTCTPLGINSHRILVTGERVTPTPIEEVQRAGAAPEIPGFPWWAIGLGATALLLGAGVWRAGTVRPQDP